MQGRLMAVRLMALVAVVALAGCGGGESEARRQQAAILAELQAIDQGIASSSDVAAALEKYEAAAAEMEALILQYPQSDEAKAMKRSLQWLKGEVKLLRTIQEANQPPPEPSPEFFK